MKPTRRRRGILLAVALLAGVHVGVAAPPPPVDHSPEAVRQQYTASADALRHSPFGRPLVIDSAEGDGTLKGSVLVEVDQPIDRVRTVLKDPAAWCEVLLLTPNVARCRVEGEGDQVRLSAALARRFDQPAKEAYASTFAFRVLADQPDFTALQLSADKGPARTSNYRFDVDALSIDGGRTVLRMAYTYSYGLAARLATQAYLSTKGSGKVGFTTVPGEGGGKPRLIGGMRGSVERNAMRYYLAIEARLGRTETDAAPRFEHALDQWIHGIEQYPEQLAEPDVAAFRKIKLEQFRDSGTP